jgi:hypothetical protein
MRLLDAGFRVPPVLTACRGYLLENTEMIRMLLDSGMNSDLPNWQRQTFLHDAVQGWQARSDSETTGARGDLAGRRGLNQRQRGGVPLDTARMGGADQHAR